MIDVDDIVIHAAIAVVAVAALSFTGLPGLALGGVNAAAWYVREGVQARRRGASVSPLKWSLQKHLEAGVPSVLGLIVGAIL